MEVSFRSVRRRRRRAPEANAPVKHVRRRDVGGVVHAWRDSAGSSRSITKRSNSSRSTAAGLFLNEMSSSWATTTMPVNPPPINGGSSPILCSWRWATSTTRCRSARTSRSRQPVQRLPWWSQLATTTKPRMLESCAMQVVDSYDGILFRQ
jgi:hypothetical protein